KVTKLYEGNEYLFQVIAVNAIGQSAPAATAEPQIAKLPFDPPNPPKNVRIEHLTKTSCTLEWEAPDYDGGSPIRGYYIEKSSGYSSRWIKANRDLLDVTSKKFKDLVEGTEYEYRVLAENEAGISKPSDTTGVFVAKDPYTKPSKPGNLTVSEKHVSLKWGEPETDGGSDITGYTIEVREAIRRSWQQAGSIDVSEKRVFTVTPLLEGQQYMFRVAAENECGVGEYAELLQAVVAKSSYPAPKVTLDKKYESDQIVKSGGTVLLDASVTGFPIPTTEWTHNSRPVATSKNVAIESTSDSTTLKISKSSTTNTGVYKIIAENEVGTDFAEINVTVMGKPSEPQNLRPEHLAVKDITGDSITLRWSPPENDGGSEIMHYIVEKRETMRRMWQAVTETKSFEYTVGRLFEGNEYVFRVMAENAVGIGAAAELRDSTTPRSQFYVPNAPRKLLVEDLGRDHVTIAWEEPDFDGGSKVAGYYVEKRQGSSSRWIRLNKGVITSPMFTVNDLMEGSEYEFRVVAENDAGESQPS
ncbi:hypothetical protein CAPTEDRAFT_34147, partial [Capitella teleta]